jgi:hypothetical protein
MADNEKLTNSVCNKLTPVPRNLKLIIYQKIVELYCFESGEHDREILKLLFKNRKILAVLMLVTVAQRRLEQSGHMRDQSDVAETNSGVKICFLLDHGCVTMRVVMQIIWQENIRLVGKL